MTDNKFIQSLISWFLVVVVATAFVFSVIKELQNIF